MCGIFCGIGESSDGKFIEKIRENCEFYVKRRGPDSYETHETVINNKNSLLKLICSASVLWLQGKNLTKQPIVTDKSIFLFNGDVFGGIEEANRKLFGDTKLLLNELESTNTISKVLSKINGPYSMIYYDKNDMMLYFGCDIYGRRSLLIGKRNNNLILTSVALKNSPIDFIEVPPIGIFCFDLKLNKFILYPWGFRNNKFNEKLEQIRNGLGFDEEIIIIQEIPLNQTISFVSPNPKDLEIFEQIKLDTKQPFEILLSNSKFSRNVDSLLNLLENSIRIRISNQPNYCQKCIFTQNFCNHATMGILFSGGVDCTILAILAHKYYDPNRPIDLLNVAFEKNLSYNTPDRESGLQSWEELKQLHPERNWNFIRINIPQHELNHQRSEHIKHLIYPLNKILDDSLGSALWFAARGISENYTSACRVLLVGMGADELFGGYTRHKASLKNQNFESLHNSLSEDFQNISQRNLARDDRVVSDHGRQLRTPYLDEEVVEFARKLNCWEKTYPSEDLPKGLGEKILLRTLAYKIGLKNASVLKKRALQFGSRIANSKENAYDVSPRL